MLDNQNSKALTMAKIFSSDSKITVVCDDFRNFVNTHDVDCIVSPANAFGLMDGGYDKAISDVYGDELQKKVQEIIIQKYGGHQPVGTALTVDINEGQKLIHVPTMIVPSTIKDPTVIYECMRATIFEAQRQKVNRIVIPLFGGLTGEVSAEIAAKMMWLGYKHAMNPNKTIDWDVAYSIADEFEDLGVSIE